MTGSPEFPGEPVHENISAVKGNTIFVPGCTEDVSGCEFLLRGEIISVMVVNEFADTSKLKMHEAKEMIKTHKANLWMFMSFLLLFVISTF